jgi:S-adenosylmethionine decarboxylase
MGSIQENPLVFLSFREKFNSMVRILEKEQASDSRGGVCSHPARALGRLAIADARCTFDKLNDIKFLEDCMKKAAVAGNLNILDSKAHRFEPQGISAILILQESHFSIHTWPEFGYVAIDIFTCGKEGNPEKAMKEFLKLLGTWEDEVKFFERGNLRADG